MPVLSYILDAAAAVLMLALLLVQKKYPDKDGFVNTNFRTLILTTLLMCFIDAVLIEADIKIMNIESLNILSLPFADAVWLIIDAVTKIANIYMTTVFLYMWIGFLAFRLYHDKGYMERKFWKDIMPLLVAGVLMIAAILLLLFTDKATIIVLVTLFLFCLVRLYYFGISLWLLFEYRSQNGKLRFFNVWAFFIPVFAGWIIEDLSYLYTRAIGCAIGVILLYISIAAEREYIDKPSGLFNRKYIDYLKDLVSKNEFAPRSALIFDIKEGTDIKSFCKGLKQALPEECEPIRSSDNRVVVLTKVKERGPLAMVLVDIHDALGAEGSSILIKKGETSEEFMERVLQ